MYAFSFLCLHLTQAILECIVKSETILTLVQFFLEIKKEAFIYTNVHIRNICRIEKTDVH